jgi:hypothetical protein
MNFYYNRGYCTNSWPREYKTILIKAANKNPKLNMGYEFDIFTISSLNWLYNLFYLKGTKLISSEIMNYLTPMSIAFLLMDYGGWLSGSNSVRISTKNLLYKKLNY